MSKLETYNRFFPYKILRHNDRLEQIAKGETPLPVMLHIYPTNACNNNCTFCIMKDEKKNVGTLTKSVLEKVLTEAKEVGVEMIHFSGGGEPLLNKHTGEAVKFAHALGLKTTVSTNGSIFNENVAKYVDTLRISLNAGTQEEYAKTMRPTSHTLDSVLQNATKYRETMKASQSVGLGYVVTPSNVYDVSEFCERAAKAGVDFVHIRPAYLPNQDEEVRIAAVIASNQAKRLQKEFPKLDIYCVSDKFAGFWTPKTYTKCRSTPLIGVLTATGEYAVCQDVFHKFGDAYKQTIKEVWGSKEHLDAMNKICLEKCPRCVETRVNEIIEHMYIDDKTLRELI